MTKYNHFMMIKFEKIFPWGFFMMIRGFFALLTAVFLASCSPISFAPGTRSSPLPTSFSTVAKIKSNAETFVQAVGPAGLLSDGIFTQPGLQFTSFGEIKVGNAKRIAVNWVEQKSIRAPEGWKFEIVFQEGVATITQATPTATGVSYRTAFTLEVIVSVKVPAGTPAGRYNAVMTIAEVGKPNNTGPIYFSFEVEKPEEK
jgi:hypothetical protein